MIFPYPSTVQLNVNEVQHLTVYLVSDRAGYLPNVIFIFSHI